MNEKISDFSIREDKIKRLKEKILSDIEDKLNLFKGKLNQSLQKGSSDYQVYVKYVFVLLNLKEYIDDKKTFLEYRAKYFDKDIVIYMVSDDYLNIWLHTDYPFVSNFIHKAVENGYNVFPMLNDDYFGRLFIDVVDEIYYSKKFKESSVQNNSK